MGDHWDFLLAEFRKLGGIADNVIQKDGECGRGIFSVDPSLKSRIFTPTKLLVKKDDIFLENNKLRIKKDKKYGQDVRNFFNFYQDNFSWGSGGKETTELFEEGLSLFNPNLKELIKKYALVDLEKRHQGTWENVVKNQFLNARVVKFKNISVIAPIWELVNHKVRSLPYIFNNDGVSTPNYSPSNADYQTGQVSLTLIATTAGECEGIITETIFVTLYQAPVFSIDEDADNDGEIFICSSAENINLNASLNVSQTSVSNLNWSGGVDGNFISGSQTFNATYRFGANEKTNGSVTLRLDADGENGCANPDQKVVIVTFLDPIANPPVKNLDPGVACLGQQNIILSVNAIAQATAYNWTVPDGIIVNSGSNSNTVNVSIDPQTTTGSKTILVTAQNDCGITSPTLFELYVSPDNIGTVSGTNSICRGDLGLNYTVDDIPGAVYSWSYSGVGATVTSGNNTNEITVDFDNTATSGSWTVTASLSCGTVTAPVNYVVTVNEIPQIDPASIENQYCSVSPLGIQLSFSNKILSEIATITWQRDQVAGVLPLTGDGNGSEINESLTNTTNSNALIVYTISTIDNNGCENQETISFELYSELNITNSNKSICSGANVNLTFVNNNTSPQLSYSWSRVLPNGITSSSNGGFNGNTISETLINSTTNSIDVVYNVTGQVSGCAQTNAVTITPSNLRGYTNIILNAPGETVTCIFKNSNWNIIGGNGYAV